MNMNSYDTETKSTTAKILGIVIPLAIFMAFMGLTMALKSIEKKPEKKKPKTKVRAVMAAPATADKIQLSVKVQGESRPRTEIDLVPEVGGKIVYVSTKFLGGGLFAKGDVLYRIDPADYQVGVIRAEAGVARAQQVLTREMAEGAIAAQDWEDLGEGRQASDLTLRKPQMLEAQAGLQLAQADLQNANLKLTRTEVTAPFNGRVREKFADIGQYVNPGARLGRIFSTDITEVRLALNDADLTRLDLPIAYVASSRASATDVKLSAIIAGELRVWDGKIMRTDSSYDSKTRSLFAIAEVVDPYGRGAAAGGFPLAPGLFVDAEIEGKSFKSVIVIPRGGLRPENKVYIVDMEGVASSRDVIVIDKNPARAVLASGVAPGELVIVSALEKSQLSLKFKALDVNDPNIILVEPKPEEDEEEDEDGDDKDKDATNEAADDNTDEAAPAKKKKRRRKKSGGN